MEQRAQGAIEYLLIIGAAILVVAIVILAVTGALGGGKNTSAAASGDYNRSVCAASCTAMGANCGTGANPNVAINCGLYNTACVPAAGITVCPRLP